MDALKMKVNKQIEKSHSLIRVSQETQERVKELSETLGRSQMEVADILIDFSLARVQIISSGERDE